MTDHPPAPGGCVLVETTARGLPPAAWRPTLAAAPPLPGLPAPGSTVCVVAAHPDDETLGAAGLLQRLAAAGVGLRVVSVTDGEAGYPGASSRERARLAAVRRDELRQALDVLGHPDARPVHLALPDGEVARHEDRLADRLVPLLAGAALCLAPWERDPHPDHRATGRAALRAGERLRARGGVAPDAWRYPIWMRHSTPPADVPAGLRTLDLSRGEAVTKRRAIDCHASQVRSPHDGRGPVLPDHVLDLFDDAEPFVVPVLAEGAEP